MRRSRLTFYKSWQLGLVILAVMACMILTIIFIESRALPIIKSYAIKVDDITDLVRDHIVGMPVIRAFNRRTYENDKENCYFYRVRTTEQKTAPNLCHRFTDDTHSI